MSKNLTSFTESLRKCRTDKQCHEKYSQHFKIGEQKKLVSSVTARSGMRINYANEGDDKQLKNHFKTLSVERFSFKCQISENVCFHVISTGCNL